MFGFCVTKLLNYEEKFDLSNGTGSFSFFVRNKDELENTLGARIVPLPKGYVSSNGEVDKFNMTTGVSTGTAIVEGAYKSEGYVKLHRELGDDGITYGEADIVANCSKEVQIEIQDKGSYKGYNFGGDTVVKGNVLKDIINNLGINVDLDNIYDGDYYAIMTCIDIDKSDYLYKYDVRKKLDKLKFKKIIAPYLVALDNGHGANTLGKRTPIFDFGPREGGFMHEWEFNYAVVKTIEDNLNRIGIKTLLVSDTREDKDLNKRTQEAIDAEATIFISVHANAKTGNWWTDNAVGIETLIHKEQLGKDSEKLANIVQGELIDSTSTYKLPNRGIKYEYNYHVIRVPPENGIPSIITECGFMDSRYDAKFLIDDEYRKIIAIAHAKGICKFLNVDYIEG